jgi:hypothetical protein
MSSKSLQEFEARLHRELPGFTWQCMPENTPIVAGTDLPEGIEIRASREGSPIGNPLYLSGNMLLRWGMDASARLVCNELSSALYASKHGQKPLDKLAEF